MVPHGIPPRGWQVGSLEHVKIRIGTSSENMSLKRVRLCEQALPIERAPVRESQMVYCVCSASLGPGMACG